MGTLLSLEECSLLRMFGMDRGIRCYMHIGGVIELNPNGKAGYKGGRSKIMRINQSISHSSLISEVSEKMNVTMSLYKIRFTTKDDPFTLLDLDDDGDVREMFDNNDSNVHLYLVAHDNEEVPGSPPHRVITPNDCSHGSNVIPSASQDNTKCHVGPSIESSRQETHGLIHRCVEGQSGTLESIRWNNAIIGSGQVFQTAAEFRDAVYLMSVAGRFKYFFKRNRRTDMTVICKVEGCPWKITCRSVSNSNVVQVHTFNNVHKHIHDDVASTKPDVKAKHAAAMIDQVVRSNPEYSPRQICNDFVREHGIHLSYYQAWNLKEKAKQRIFGEPKNYYKLLPWLCDKIRGLNPLSCIELMHYEGRFKQLFLAHGFSIHGFQAGCRPIIVIDSCHVSGSYGGVLFSATTYDANDDMFPLAIGIMSSGDHEDWYWFLQHLKRVVGDREVVIISDRRPALLSAVPELFGYDNHAYCYRHVKENFSSFVNEHSKKGKENAMKFLDDIAYARLDHDYVSTLHELRRFNPELATWVESNEPEHWAMSKFPKKRWDKMLINLADSMDTWLKFERHHSICTFISEHMHTVGTLLNRHKEQKKWDASIGPNIEEKLNINITNSASYSVIEVSEGKFCVSCGNVMLNVNLIQRQCTCKAWDMSGIPCEHACAAIQKIDQNPIQYVDEWYSYSKQDMIFSGSFSPFEAETHDMPTIHADGVVRDSSGNTVFSLLPPLVKHRVGRPRKNITESQIESKKLSCCTLCHEHGHNKKTCSNRHKETE